MALRMANMLREPGRFASCRASKLVVIAVDCASMTGDFRSTVTLWFSAAISISTLTVAVKPRPTWTLHD